MKKDELRRAATSAALELPGADIYDFIKDWQAARVAGKWFLLLPANRALITLKAHPDDARELTAAYPSITPGYHMNKKHWISVTASDDERGDDVSADLVRELVIDSYLAVLSGVPKNARPVNVDAFIESRLGG